MIEGTTPAAEPTKRERCNRRAIFPIASSFHSSIPPEERQPPARFSKSTFQARVKAAVIATNGVPGVSFNPTAVEAETTLAADLAGAHWAMVKREGRVRVYAAEPEEDRRRRPHGYSDVAISKACRMNPQRVYNARHRLIERAGGLIVTRQPHRFVEEKGRYEGLPGIHELLPRFFELHGIPWSEVEAEHERREVERALKEQLEGQQRALEQQAARDLRGVDHPLVQPNRAQRKTAAVVLDYPKDDQNRRMPHSPEEIRRCAEIAFSPDLVGLPSELRRDRALARWREELGPPT